MILERDAGPIGSWWFEDRRQPVDFSSRDNLLAHLKMLQTAAEVLEAHGLLRPERLTFSGWFGVSANGQPVRVEGDDIVVEIPTTKGSSARNLVTAANQALDEAEKKRPFRYPIDIDVQGSGVVHDAQGKEITEPDVVWLWGRALDGHAVDVRTQSDVWLPFTLAGDPQPEVAARNAPRLEAALREIQNRLGVVVNDDERTEYARMDGFTLRNFTDVDGEIVAFTQN